MVVGAQNLGNAQSRPWCFGQYLKLYEGGNEHLQISPITHSRLNCHSSQKYEIGFCVY